LGGTGGAGRPRYQRLQSLFRRRVTLVVQAVELERLQHARDVLPGGDHPRFVRTADDFRHDQRGENAEDDDHHHHLEQRESALP
jgi:hypothetical protein